MIIWGSYVMNKVLQRGSFDCPHCRTQQDYTLKRPRKWGHLYWIPLIPMKDYPHVVECQACSRTYYEEVLGTQPSLAPAE